MKNSQRNICFFCVFIITILIYTLFYCIEYNESWIHAVKHRTIEKDGFILLSYDDDFKSQVLETLPPGYHFANYSYAIKNATISTFHRDVTSSQKMEKKLLSETKRKIKRR